MIAARFVPACGKGRLVEKSLYHRNDGFGTPDLVGSRVQGGIDHGGSLSNFGIARGESSMPSDPPDV
jgi:hypothetical protein